MIRASEKKVKEFINEFHDIKSIIADQKGELFNLVNGKSVAVVGPPQENSSIKRREIEKCDLIVRCNVNPSHLPFKDEISNKIGKRTDIAYLNFSGENNFLNKLNDSFSEKIKMIRLVGPYGVSKTPLLSLPATYSARTRDFQKKLEGYSIPTKVHYSSIVSFFLQEQLTKFKKSPPKSGMMCPRTGYLAIVEMLLCGARSVSVSNMTFYHGGSSIFWVQSIKKLNPLENERGQIKPYHDSKRELEQLEAILKELGSKKLILSDELLSLIEVL
jgi:hypothetical protein